MDENVTIFLFHFLNLVDIQGVEEHFFFLGESLGCKMVFVDVDKAVIVFIPFCRQLSLFDVDDKDVPISICKFFSGFNAFGGGHEPVHLNEDSWLKTVEISFLESSSSVQLHSGYFSVVLLDKLIVEYFDRVIGLIKRQNARLKLFC